MKTLVEKVENWISKLEQEAYPQGMHRLKSVTDSGKVIGLCCLGVAVEEDDDYIFQKLYSSDPNVITFDLSIPNSSFIELYKLSDNMSDIGVTKESFDKWTKSIGRKVEFTDVPLSNLLIKFNDRNNLSFPEIGNFLRTFYLPYIKQNQQTASEEKSDCFIK